MTSSNLSPMSNAWIFLNEDEPKDSSGVGVKYDDPSSSYQRLITQNVYQSVDILFLCFAEIVAASGGGYTLQIGNGEHPQGSKTPTSTNQDYMNWIIRDARKNNPNILISMTLGYGNADMINQIFTSGTGSDEHKADGFAKNLVSYLNANSLDGLDIDWEGTLAYGTTKDHMTKFIKAVGKAFKAETSRKLWFTMGPNTTYNLDAKTTNAHVDFLSLQLYGAATKQGFLGAGIDGSLLAYGAHFEPGSSVGAQTADEAFQGYQSGGYTVATAWRLNSNNFVHEQDAQVKFYAKIHGT